MSEIINEFERWWHASKYMQVIFSSDQVKQPALDGWNACQRLNDARINTLNEALVEDKIIHAHIEAIQSENERLREQVESLLAVVAAKDEALQEVVNVFETPDHPGICDTVWVTGNRPETLYECAQAALALKPSDVELVEVGKVCFEDTLVGVDLTNANIKHDDKVYVLKQKEGE